MQPSDDTINAAAKEEWERRLTSVRVSKSDLNKVVMNFLVTEVRGLFKSHREYHFIRQDKSPGVLRGLDSCCPLAHPRKYLKLTQVFS
jgi:hypothetical protein